MQARNKNNQTLVVLCPWKGEKDLSDFKIGKLVTVCVFLLSLAIAEPAHCKVVKDDLYAVQAIGNDVWACGYHGLIVHSKDKGESWSIQESNKEESFFDICFVNNREGWIIGSYGTILHTGNGGLSWEPQVSKVNLMLFDGFFLDSQTGWVCGQEGTLLYTNNGGKTWEQKPQLMDFDFYGLYFLDVNHGWVVGEFGVIYKTDDGGKSWEKQKNPAEISYLTGSQECFFRIIFDQAGPGYVFFMDGGLLVTKDMGNLWEIVPKVTVNHFFNGAVNKDKLWAVGQRGTLVYYYDDVAHSFPLNTKRHLLSISFSADGYGILVGSAGTVFMTLDDGKTWTRKILIPGK